MDGKDEPDWVIAQRKEKRQFDNALTGVRGALRTVVLILFLLAWLNANQSFVALGITIPLLLIAAIYTAWRSPVGSVFRAWAVTLAIIFGFGTFIVSIIYFAQR
jgi:hypothetical protein